MRGEPLVAKGEAGHVRLFDLDPTGDGPITVTGSVAIARKAVRVEPSDGVPGRNSPTERDDMIQKMTDIVMERFIDDKVEIEGWTDGGS